jgi:predicted nucleotidyltransferase
MNGADLEAMRAVLDRPGVVAASVFGSRATGRAHPRSDVDVAVWLDPGLEPARRLSTRLALERALAAVCPGGPVDLVVLNDAPLALRHRARAEGRPFLDRDPRTRVRLETDSLIAYLDNAALRRELARGQDARLAEGRFGRP